MKTQPNSKTATFYILLIVFLFLDALLMMWAARNSQFLLRASWMFHAFIPAVAVLIAERKNLKVLPEKYFLRLKGVHVKNTLYYIIGVCVCYPLIGILLASLFGNVFGWNFAGLFNLNLVFLPAVLLSLVFGLTFNMLYALGGELAWRGFLSQHLSMNYYARNVLTGLIWGTWVLPVVLFGVEGFHLNGYNVFMSYCTYIVASFFLDKIYRDTRSLWVVSVVHSLLFFSGLLSFFIQGSFAFTSALSILILFLLSKVFIKPEEPQITLVSTETL